MIKPKVLDPRITVGDREMFDFLCPKPKDITLRQIVYSISKMCRFTGHVAPAHDPDAIYSVAEHCILVSRIASYLHIWNQEPERRAAAVAMDALMHDAHEAYVGDVSSPLKSLIRELYKPIENRAEDAVIERFRLTPRAQRSPLVKVADTMAYLIERDTIMPRLLETHPEHKYLPWPIEYKNNEKQIRSLFRVHCYSPAKARMEFEERFFALDRTRYQSWTH